MTGRKKKRRDKKSKSAERIERLMPLDQQFYAADPPRESSEEIEEGILRVTTGSLRLPEEFVPDPDSESARAANRVVVVIVVLSLAFIAWIAWMIVTSGE